MVDKALILRKIADLDRYLAQVGEYAGIDPNSYRADWKIQRIVERTLQMLVETCADIANHIIADGGMRIPTSYADTFRVLFENHVVTADQLSVMDRMAKFRNIVVHQYEGVDAGIVVLILRNHLADFDSFKRAVIAYIGRAD